MPTISAGNTAEVYCPLASSVTFTPGGGGTMRLGFAVTSGAAAIAPQTIGAATSMTVSAGATVFAQAIGADATYTAPAGVDTALQALVSDAGNVLEAAAAAPQLGYEQAADAYRPSPNYRLFIQTGTERTGVARSRAGRGIVEAGAGNDVMWSTAGYISSKATASGTDGGMKLGRDFLNWDLVQGQSLIVAFTMKAAVKPAGTVGIFGTCRQGSQAGIGIRVTASGFVTCKISNGTTALDSTTGSTDVCTGADVPVVIMIDGRTKLLYQWIGGDGTRDTGYQISTATMSTGSTVSTANQCSLGNANSGTSDATLAINFKNVHVLTIEGELPTNFSSIARFLLRDMGRAIPAYMVSQPIPDEFAVPTTTAATEATKAVYRLFKQYSGDAAHMLGVSDRHHSRLGPQKEGTADNINTITGRLPALLAWEYVDPNEAETTALATATDGNPASGESIGTGAQRYANLIADIKAHHRRGGISMVHDHPGKPGVGTGMATSMSAITYDDGNSGNPVTECKTGGTLNAEFLGYLDRFAAFCASLTDDSGNRIPVIWRPFHEANNVTGSSSGFWWAGTSQAADLILLWQQMHTYLVTTKGVTNLLFCWNLNSTETSGSPYDPNTTAYTTWYPGDSYVDIVSLDYYRDTEYTDSLSYSLDNTVILRCWAAAEAIALTSRKPMAWAEVGARYGQSYLNLWDRWGAESAEMFRGAALVGLWRSPWGPTIGDANSNSLVAWTGRDYCITLDKLPTWQA